MKSLLPTATDFVFPGETADAGGREPAATEPAPAARTLPPGTSVPLLAGLWIVAATALSMLRQPGVPSWNAFWAEDGEIFFQGALERSLLSGVVQDWAGYLHLAPRLVGEVATLVPLRHAPFVFALLGSLVVAVLSTYVFFASRSVLSTVWARALVAGLFVLAPVTAFEVAANAVDLHWYLLYAAFWALLARPTTRGGRVAGAVVVVVATLSDPLVALLAPLAILQALADEGRRRWVTPGLLFLALVVQGIVSRTGDAPERFTPFDAVDIPGIFGLRVAGSALVGDRHVGDFWTRFGWAFVVASLIVVAIGVVLALRATSGGTRRFVVIAVGYSVLVALVPLVVRGTGEMAPMADMFSYNGSRYTVMPIQLLTVAAIAVVDRGVSRRPFSAWRTAQYALALHALVVVLLGVGITNVRSPGPPWREALQAAEAQCATPAQTVEILTPPAAPPDDPGAWTVTVRCEDL